jgi:hypothetical protein
LREEKPYIAAFSLTAALFFWSSIQRSFKEKVIPQKSSIFLLFFINYFIILL